MADRLSVPSLVAPALRRWEVRAFDESQHPRGPDGRFGGAGDKTENFPSPKEKEPFDLSTEEREAAKKAWAEIAAFKGPRYTKQDVSGTVFINEKGGAPRVIGKTEGLLDVYHEANRLAKDAAAIAEAAKQNGAGSGYWKRFNDRCSSAQGIYDVYRERGGTMANPLVAVAVTQHFDALGMHDVHQEQSDGWVNSSSSDAALKLHTILRDAGVPGFIPAKELTGWAKDERLEKYTRAMYALSQASLEADGVKEVHLYRGVDGEVATLARTQASEMVNVTTRPASSWTDHTGVAARFAHIPDTFHDPGGVVLEASFSAKSVYTNYRLFGNASNEDEYVILGAEKTQCRVHVSLENLPSPEARSSALRAAQVATTTLDLSSTRLEDWMRSLAKTPEKRAFVSDVDDVESAIEFYHDLADDDRWPPSRSTIDQMLAQSGNPEAVIDYIMAQGDVIARAKPAARSAEKQAAFETFLRGRFTADVARRVAALTGGEIGQIGAVVVGNRKAGAEFLRSIGAAPGPDLAPVVFDEDGSFVSGDVLVATGATLEAPTLVAPKLRFARDDFEEKHPRGPDGKFATGVGDAAKDAVAVATHSPAFLADFEQKIGFDAGAREAGRAAWKEVNVPESDSVLAHRREYAAKKWDEEAEVAEKSLAGVLDGTTPLWQWPSRKEQAEHFEGAVKRYRDGAATIRARTLDSFREPVGHRVEEYLKRQGFYEHEFVTHDWKSSSSAPYALRLHQVLSADGVPGAMANRYEPIDAEGAKPISPGYVKAVYGLTQAALEAEGTKEVVLYRGVRQQATDLHAGDAVELKTRPASSWTPKREIAEQFAFGIDEKGEITNGWKSDEAKQGRVVKATVPASAVYASHHLFVNYSSENEYVVLGAQAIAAEIVGDDLPERAKRAAPAVLDASDDQNEDWLRAIAARNAPEKRADWTEADHPRAPDGKFGAGDGAPAKSAAGEAFGFPEMAGKPLPASIASLPADHVERKAGEVEWKLLPLDHEEAAVFNLAGDKVAEKRGAGTSVEWTEKEVAAMKAQGGVVFTHNHPLPRPLSFDDVLFAAKADLLMMRCITKLPSEKDPDGPAKATLCYVMRPDAGWPALGLLRQKMEWQWRQTGMDAMMARERGVSEIGATQLAQRWAVRGLGVGYHEEVLE